MLQLDIMAIMSIVLYMTFIGAAPVHIPDSKGHSLAGPLVKQ